MASHAPASPYTLAALKGGAQGLFHTRPATPLAHVIIVVGAGYLDEPESTPGLAHLLEHVLLTQPVVQGRSLLALTEQLGGKLNARTDDLITDIHANLPASSLSPFLTYLHQALFAPWFDDATIVSESAAIDAEYQARLGTPAMRRLAGLQALAEGTHPGAFCHHGSRHSLGRPPEILKGELGHFHRRWYVPSRISVGLSAPLPQVQQQALLDAFLPGDYSPTPPGAKPPSRRWHPAAHKVELEGAASSVELLWPLAEAGLAHSMEVLKATEQALNAGALTQLLDGLADDYDVTLCPSGATDTLAVTVHLPADKQRELLTRSADITQVLNRTLEAHDERAPVSVDRPSLAEWLFTQTRQQAIAQRFGPAGPVQSTPGLLAIPAPYALLTAPQNAKAHEVVTQNPTTPSASVISKVGDSGGTGLPAHWFACFYPDKKIALPALAQKRLAAQSIALLQHTTAHGSWLCAHGAQPLANTLSKIMLEAWLTPLPTPTGLQAHRMLAELTPSPAMPLLWTDSTEAAGTLSPLLAALTEAPIPCVVDGPATPSHRVTLMRTLTLPGSAAHRQVMAIAAKRHSATFFHAMRHTHQLGYIAAVRFIDGDPASVAYLVQCPPADITQAQWLIQDEIERLWAQLLKELADEWPLPHEEFTGLDIPETPTAVLVAHWHAHLNASLTPLYRLPCPAASSFLIDDWRRWLGISSHWAWWQRDG
tara:strand:+ start:1262 stop:3391 length:2130 start_codon:yes stop_codon:yes gene_type:complete